MSSRASTRERDAVESEKSEYYFSGKLVGGWVVGLGVLIINEY